MAGKACHVVASTTRFGLTQALGRMKRFAGNIAIIAGTLLVLAGVAGSPLIQDLLPVTSPFGGNTHTFLRVVPTDPAPWQHLWFVLIVVGALVGITGIEIRRRPAA